MKHPPVSGFAWIPLRFWSRRPAERGAMQRRDLLSVFCALMVTISALLVVRWIIVPGILGLFKVRS
jgi:hypothetical protein